MLVGNHIKALQNTSRRAPIQQDPKAKSILQRSKSISATLQGEFG
jgi:hypothetical protein